MNSILKASLLGLALTNLVSGHVAARAATTTTSSTKPACTDASSCTTLLGAEVIASGPCVDLSGNACTNANVASLAAAYSRAHGGVSLAYDSNFNYYAISVPASQAATQMNVINKAASSTCSSATIRGFVVFDNACFPPKCNSASTCISLIQGAGYLISTTTCASYSNGACTSSNLSKWANLYSRSAGGVTLGYDNNGNVYAFSGTPAQINAVVGATLVTKGSCTGFSSYGLGVFDNACYADGTCATATSKVLASDGTAFYGCPNTDYSEPSVGIYSSIATAGDCVTICENMTGCKYVVYWAQDQVCFTKDSAAPQSFGINNDHGSIAFFKN